MPKSDFQGLMSAAESPTIEFKTSIDKARMETLVAFANAQSGNGMVELTNV